MKVLATVIMLVVWGYFGAIYEPQATLIAGQSAGQQFQPSDGAYLQNEYTQSGLQIIRKNVNLAIPVLIVFMWLPALGRLYRRRVMDSFKDNSMFVLFALAAGSMLTPQPVKAYYAQQDYSENYFILPNESAFWIPDVGDNKSNQAQFMSEQYLKDNKIPAKRFNIPHTKLPNSGVWSNYYVPAGRLIVLDRTTFSREWVAQAHRGTSAKDESFPCQSSEGLDISVGVAIGASLTEDNSPKFLYNFGVLPPTGDRNQPEVIFQSVYQGRSLTSVMDGPVRSKVQALVCDNITMGTLDENNKNASRTMVKIEKDVRAYMDSVGITLQYVGWADTFTFEKPVQDAINRKYVADKEVEIANVMAPNVATMQGLAQAEAVRAAANKWDGKVPSSVSLWWLPSSLTDMISNVFSGKK